VEGLTTFAATHRRYIDAQRVVEAAEAQLAAAAAFLRHCDGEQDAGVEILARALMADGQPRHNPFRAFGVPSPALLQRLAAADEAKTIHHLVAVVQRIQGASNSTLQAAQTADTGEFIPRRRVVPKRCNTVPTKSTLSEASGSRGVREGGGVRAPTAAADQGQWLCRYFVGREG